MCRLLDSGKTGQRRHVTHPEKQPCSSSARVLTVLGSPQAREAGGHHGGMVPVLSGSGTDALWLPLPSPVCVPE